MAYGDWLLYFDENYTLTVVVMRFYYDNLLFSITGNYFCKTLVLKQYIRAENSFKVLWASIQMLINVPLNLRYRPVEYHSFHKPVLKYVACDVWTDHVRAL